MAFERHSGLQPCLYSNVVSIRLLRAAYRDALRPQALGNIGNHFAVHNILH